MKKQPSDMRQRSWQKQWRELLGEPPTDRPWFDDFVLHFALSSSEKEQRDALLSILPLGREVAERVDRVGRAVRTPTDPLNDSELLSLARKLVDACHRLAPFDADRPFGIPGHTPPVPPPDRYEVRRISEGQRAAAFVGRGLAIESVRDTMSSAARRGAQRDAMRFLNEPLYQLTTMFEPKVWVLWPYVAERWGAECLLEPAFELWRHGAQVLVGPEDVVVAVASKSR